MTVGTAVRKRTLQRIVRAALRDRQRRHVVITYAAGHHLVARTSAVESWVVHDPRGPMGCEWLWTIWSNPWGLGPAALLHYQWTTTERRARADGKHWGEPIVRRR